jgi:hypothetical protein
LMTTRCRWSVYNLRDISRIPSGPSRAGRSHLRRSTPARDQALPRQSTTVLRRTVTQNHHRTPATCERLRHCDRRSPTRGGDRLQ